jgi:hypothetical protein
MDDRYLVMMFGGLLSLIGIVVSIFERQESGVNTIRLAGFGEVTVSARGLIIFMVGALIFVMPLLVGERAGQDQARQPPSSDRPAIAPTPATTSAPPAESPPNTGARIGGAKGSPNR